ncbi:MAG: hypothetical protein KGJ23_14135 [Euryarchaeota archaeon]|nr:hypothetical protein [Euryarchaeota archaeon]MDE1837738.1 hypothetical protein [Euryarchaeota archaeon]MDE2046099.1 hypothetical protein [Thermoplasmata archaeon]
MREVDLRAPVQRFLAERGYRIFVDPDGTDYFDVVAVKGEEVGLIELKVADWRRVREQALVRRGWGDWVAVLLPRRSLAERVLRAESSPRSDRVGVWVLEEGEVRVCREARPMVAPGETTVFPGLKQHLLASLAMREAGLLPPEVQWRIVHTPLTRGGRRRRMSGKEWKLEEFADPPRRDPEAPK